VAWSPQGAGSSPPPLHLSIHPEVAGEQQMLLNAGRARHTAHKDAGGTERLLWAEQEDHESWVSGEFPSLVGQFGSSPMSVG